MTACNVCGEELSQPIYQSPQDRSLTSLCELRPGRTEVYFCARCGHLQTTPLAEIDEYYESQYRILLDSEDEDQLYQIKDGQKIFRIDHQVQTLLRKVPLATGARVLDYGCAKGASAKRLTQLRPDVDACLFDVSSMYKPFWERFTNEQHWATHQTKPEWQASFDVVMSFYVMEHVAEPVAILRQISALLKPQGVLYWLVPNFIANPADMIVADHVNHFSRQSLDAVVQKAGLNLIEIDEHSHEAGWIIIAGKETQNITQPQQNTSIDDLRIDVLRLAAYWRDLGCNIQMFEITRRKSGPAAIYGSGFYGTFVTSCLDQLQNIKCFIDQSPFRQGKTLFEKPIVAPEKLDQEIQTVYIGLNPRTARQSIADIACWRDRTLTYFYL